MDKAFDNLLSAIVLGEWWDKSIADKGYLLGLKDAYQIITGKQPNVYLAKHNNRFCVDLTKDVCEYRYGEIVYHEYSHTVEAVLD